MKRFKLSPEAAQDIREIWAYVADDSMKAARRPPPSPSDF